MTQEDKQLLALDISSRLQYGVLCSVPGQNHPMVLTGAKFNYFYFHDRDLGYDYTHEIECVIDPLNDASNGYIVKPYLRSVSTMTEDEKWDMYGDSYVISIDFERRTTDMVAVYNSSRVVDWLNEHHFDYRGLIEKGLALEAPCGMYESLNNTTGNE